MPEGTSLVDEGNMIVSLEGNKFLQNFITHQNSQNQKQLKSPPRANVWIGRLRKSISTHWNMLYEGNIKHALEHCLERQSIQALNS